MTPGLAVRRDLQPPRQVIQRHSRSFSLAVKLLPEPARSDACVIYAWCRHADDAIDTARGRAQCVALARLRADLERVYASSVTPEGWLLQSFREVVRRREIPFEYPAELLAGMEMDVLHRGYESMEELTLYCYRVASTVGLMMCHVFGAFEAAALRHAAHLGIAMQLTNICRDVAEDWGRGRLYLPRDLLRRYGAGQLADGALGPGEAPAFPVASVEPCRRVLAELLAVADRYYASGDAGLRYLPWRAALAVAVARRVYSAIGSVIARCGHDVTAGRAVVSGTRKALLVAGALAQTLASQHGCAQSPRRAALPTVQYGPHLARL